MSLADDLRAVMRRFPSGVAVVTVEADGRRIGLTVASLVSLSLGPPLVGVAISRQAAAHELLREAGAFSVNVLGAGQERLAQHFARGVPPLVMWAGIEVRDGELGAPLLAEAAGWLECLLRAEHGTGDHTLFVGEVVHAAEGVPVAGLAYHGQEYVAL
jgi:flavin reductase (DIM6/NTAB) family NADH-FMN oxidoreductase RutF